MFLNTQVFKKMVTNAWKTHNLNVADMGDRWYIGCGTWAAWIEKAVFPKKALAAVIELTGEMPGDGRAFVAGKGLENDYSPDNVEISSAGIFWDGGAEDVKATSVTLECGGRKLRLLQEWGSWKISMVDDVFVQFVDPGAIDAELESAPGGACIKGGMALWQGDRCMLLAGLYGLPEAGTQESMLLRELEKMELPEMKRGA